VRRYYQYRSGIGVSALQNGEQKLWAVADDFAMRQGSTYYDPKKSFAAMLEPGTAAASR
jgi:hypothetical protein